MRVYLPVVEAQKTLPSSKEEQTPQISKSGRVLVIDDDDVLLKVCGRMLERLGFDVFSAESGAKGIEVYKSKHEEIDGVLLDLTMPRMGGEETFRRLREVKAGVRVVIMTGYDETHAMTRFNAGDVVGFLSKPFTAEDLCRRVVALVRPTAEVLNPVKSSG